jgi:hypothetical protein
MEAAANITKSGSPNTILQTPIGGQYAILPARRRSAFGAKRQRGSFLLRVRFLRTSGLIGEKVTKILFGPGSLRGHQLNFPIALAEAIALNVWKLGLAFVSPQYRAKSSALTSINMTSHPLLCQFAISFAWR